MCEQKYYLTVRRKENKSGQLRAWIILVDERLVYSVTYSLGSKTLLKNTNLFRAAFNFRSYYFYDNKICIVR